ncbi:MAG: 4-(cytidine 5'-diphospho)-2-C-methyl-D-erythritol kinase [Planctomycetes bacterium]|nr:4-(cytidine 5'-diphospho)-2-C-methyl-D-erythritol kinase [Planctomycetota bacterium]
MIQSKAPAKINLTLAVRERRPDGFHEIESWIVPIALYDTLSFAPSDAWMLEVIPPTPTVAVDESNLVARAARALAGVSGVPCRARVTLQKQIPVGAGLGGGSSDAAATLLGLNQLWNLHWPIERLLPIAASLGSDVPLFLDPCPVIVRGRGEVMEKLSKSWRGWVAIVIPSFGLATADVYRRHAETVPASVHRNQPWIAASQDASTLSHQLFNDLESAAFAIEPRLGKIRDDLSNQLSRSVRMTGSGSCLFSIFDSPTEAEAWSGAASPIIGPGYRVVVVPTLN